MKKYHAYLALTMLLSVGWCVGLVLSALIWDVSSGQGMAIVFGGFVPVVISAYSTGAIRSKALGGKGIS